MRRTIPQSHESLAKRAKRDDVHPQTMATGKQRTQGDEAPMGPQPPRATLLTREAEARIVAGRQQTLVPLEDCLSAWHPRGLTGLERHGSAAGSGMASAADRTGPARRLPSRRSRQLRSGPSRSIAQRSARQQARAPSWAPWTVPAYVPLPSGTTKPTKRSQRRASGT